MNDNLIENIGKEIYSLYFKRNFGLASKSEVESILFNLYINDKKNKDEDYSDRCLSRELGISQARVKSLKRTCYARYEEEINFPELLKSLSNSESSLMFFSTSTTDTKMNCKITVREVVYLDELCVQLTNCNIHFDKKAGNYIELSMLDTINFFTYGNSPIHEDTKELNKLIDELKTIDFNNDKSQVIKSITKGSKFVSTIEAILKLNKQY